MRIGSLPLAFAVVSYLVLLAGVTTGLVSASNPIPTPPPPPNPVVPPSSSSDRVVLTVLYNATDGPNWSNNHNWLTDAPLEEWYGIVTDGNNQVVHLHLSDNSLEGTLPIELGSLTNLKFLYLDNNQLTGEIPAELSSLSNLVLMSLSKNQLNGEIPWQLGYLTKLESLSLYENQLTGEIPSELSWLSNLRSLLLWTNQLTGEIPRELGDLTKLEWLALYNNRLSGEIPSELSSLSNLHTLFLSINQLSGEIPQELGALTKLESLSVYSNRLTGQIPPRLGDLNNLNSLTLSYNELSGQIPPELGGLSGLAILDLSHNQLSGDIPSKLGRLSILWVLNLDGNQLTGEIPQALAKLTDLIILSLANNQLAGQIPLEMGRLTNLKHLELSGNQLDGCIPWGLDVADKNDLADLGLPFCRIPAPPTNLALIVDGDNSLTTTWDAPATGPTVSAYDLRYILAKADETVETNWTVVHNVWADTGPHSGHVRAMKTCSVTWAGAAGSSMTSRVRCTQPPLSVVWHSGQNSGAWVTCAVGSIRGRAKPCRRFLRGFFSSPAALLRLAAGLCPGILAPGPPPDRRASRLSIRRHVISGLSAGEHYDVQVRAVNADGQGPVNADGQGPWSGTVSGTPTGHIKDEDSLGNKVAHVKVEASPDFPNAVAQWTVQFLNGDTSQDLQDETANKDQNDNILEGGPGKGVVMIEFEDDVQFPEAVSLNDVVITANLVWDGQAMERTVVANPLGISLTKVSQFAGNQQQTDRPIDETLVTLEIPDMEPADNRPGAQGIAPGATVTVTFRQIAGIKNPTESKADEVHPRDREAAVDANGDFDPSLLPTLSGYKVQVATSNDSYFVPAAPVNRAPIPRRLVLSDMSGPRGSTVTVVGLGFRNSLTATVWNDRNQNGFRDGGEIDLGSALITGSDDFTTTIYINNPPFSSNLSTNGINAVDLRNRTIIPGRRYIRPISGIISTESIPEYLLEPSAEVVPGTAAIGDRVQVAARDFVPGGNTQHARISISSVPVTDVESQTVGTYGYAFFEITIPDGVMPGPQELVIRDGPDAVNNPVHNLVNTEGARAPITITGVVPRTVSSPIIRTPTVPGDHSLTLNWRAPIETGKPVITSYDLRYTPTGSDETVETEWTLVQDVWTIGFSPLEYVLEGLTTGVQYDLQLRAVNAAGSGPWSATATGTPSTWGATRSFSQEYVPPGSEVTVNVHATGYGLYGQVIETLPPGFSYTGTDLVEDEVIVSGREIIFFLYRGEERFTYTVTTPGTWREQLPTPTPLPPASAARDQLPTPTPPPRPRGAGEYSFSGGLVNDNRLQQAVGGASRIRVGAAPLVYVVNHTSDPVRIHSPIPVTVTFSEFVSGFGLDDINAVNATVSNLAGSSKVYTFDVMPSGISEVTINIAAGAATDAWENASTPATPLLLGIPYDDDHNGLIGKDEAITAVIDYFSGRITKEQAIMVIILYFSA